MYNHNTGISFTNKGYSQKRMTLFRVTLPDTMATRFMRDNAVVIIHSSEKISRTIGTDKFQSTEPSVPKPEGSAPLPILTASYTTMDGSMVWSGWVVVQSTLKTLPKLFKLHGEGLLCIYTNEISPHNYFMFFRQFAPFALNQISYKDMRPILPRYIKIDNQLMETTSLTDAMYIARRIYTRKGIKMPRHRFLTGMREAFLNFDKYEFFDTFACTKILDPTRNRHKNYENIKQYEKDMAANYVELSRAERTRQNKLVSSILKKLSSEGPKEPLLPKSAIQHKQTLTQIYITKPPRNGHKYRI